MQKMFMSVVGRFLSVYFTEEELKLVRLKILQFLRVGNLNMNLINTSRDLLHFLVLWGLWKIFKIQNVQKLYYED